MSSTFTGPIRIFKRNNPTNNGVIAPDNTGAARCSQQSFIAPITATTSGAVVLPTFDIGQTTATPFVLPAGAIIENIKFYETTIPSALTGGVITVNLLTTSPTTGNVTTTAIGTITPTATNGGVISIAFATTAAATALLANIGTLDATLQFSQATISALTGTLAGTFTAEYTARNVDGSTTAYGSGYTNN